MPQWISWRHRTADDTDDARPKIPLTRDGTEIPETTPGIGQRSRPEEVEHLDRAAFVFADTDLLGLDLDGAWIDADPVGAPAPWAVPILARIPGYAEISPNGSGIHFLFRMLDQRRRELGRRTGEIFGPDGETLGTVELLRHYHWLTWTGRIIPGRPNAISTMSTEDLEWLGTTYLRWRVRDDGILR